MSKDTVEERIENLEKKIGDLNENIGFIKELLSHLHSQFQEFKKDIEKE